MSFIHRIKWFQAAVISILCFFLGLMAIVTFAVYSRRSGSTGMDMGQVQQMRYEANQKLIDNPKY